jgi:hypothetical protein
MRIYYVFVFIYINQLSFFYILDKPQKKKKKMSNEVTIKCCNRIFRGRYSPYEKVHDCLSRNFEKENRCWIYTYGIPGNVNIYKSFEENDLTGSVILTLQKVENDSQNSRRVLQRRL